MAAEMSEYFFYKNGKKKKKLLHEIGHYTQGSMEKHCEIEEIIVFFSAEDGNCYAASQSNPLMSFWAYFLNIKCINYTPQLKDFDVEQSAIFQLREGMHLLF